jgi:predicted lipoprotein with Yx(FWY)xxD motif
MLSVTLHRTAVVASGAALLLVGAVSAAFASPSVSVATSTSIGHTILTDDQGMTLYRLTKDQNGTSSCFDACATAWPPVVVDAVPAESDATLAQNLGLSPRPDGTQQLTFKNQPLYHYVGDSQPGDTNGQGSGGVWFVVDAPAPSTQATTGATTTPGY